MTRKLRTSLLILTVLIAGFMAQSAWATTYYVATNGSNSGSGTQASPWQSVSYAASKVGSGNTIYVNAGTYTDNTTVNLGTGVSIIGAGSSSVTINTSAGTYINAVSGVPAVNGSNEISGITFTGTGTAIYSVGRSNQKIHDCNFNNFGRAIDINGKISSYSTTCATSPPTQTATFCDGAIPLSTEPLSTDWATGVQIYNNNLTNTKLYPNTIKGASIHDNVIDNSASLTSAVGNTAHWWNGVQFYNNTMKMQTIAWSTIAIEVWMVEGDTKFYNNWTNGWFSILVTPANGVKLPYAWEIVNNTFASNVPRGVGSGAVQQALETCYYSENVLIADNYFTNTGSNGTYANAIGIHGKGVNKNFMIRNNVMYNLAGDGIAINSNELNEIAFAGSEINIFNNIFDTMHGGTSQGVYMEDGRGTINGVNIKNNIFLNVAHGALIAPAGNDVANIVFSNNILPSGNYTSNYGSAAGVANAGFTTVTNNYNITPVFQATGTRPSPYYRAAGQTANFVDKGANVGLPFVGTAPDIGAFEYMLQPYPPTGVGISP